MTRQELLDELLVEQFGTPTPEHVSSPDAVRRQAERELLRSELRKPSRRSP